MNAQRTVWCLFVVMCVGGLALSAGAQEPQKLRIDADSREDVMVTVYNNNYGLVREVRRVTLPKGTLELEVRDVAEKIDPTSVAFKSLTAPFQIGIYEQNYRYDLLSPQTLLNKFVGRRIRISNTVLKNKSQIVESRQGKLLSTNNGNIVQFSNGEIAINPPGSISVAEVPEDLIAKPSLVWLLGNEWEDEQEIEISYLTNDMRWHADYVSVINPDDTELDLTGWVTLKNHSGTTFPNAALKLIAGDVRRVEPERKVRTMAGLGFANERMPSAPQFEEKAFFEYHLYTLGRRTTLANMETKQMTLLEGKGVPAQKKYIVESPPWARQATARGVEKRDVQVKIEFENKKENNLGIALPAGRVRVYKADTDGSLQLVGEDRVDHTPKDEKVRLLLGNAFDIVAERSQTDYRKISSNKAEFAYRVTLRNHKEEPVTINVMEHVWGDWKMLEESHDHTKRDASTIEFQVPVDADGEATLTYRVRVKW